MISLRKCLGVNRGETRLRGFFARSGGLLTDKTTLFLERGKEGKFEAKSTSWEQNATFLPGEQLRIEVVSSGQIALTRWRSETRAASIAARAAVPVNPKAAGGLGAAVADVTASTRLMVMALHHSATASLCAKSVSSTSSQRALLGGPPGRPTPPRPALLNSARVVLSVNVTCPTVLKRGLAARTASCAVSSSRARPPAVHFPKAGSGEKRPGFRPG